MARTPARKRPARTRKKSAATTKTAKEAVTAPPPEPDTALEAAPETELSALPPMAAPETAFAARGEPRPPPPPMPTHRRATCVDVENTSRASDVARILSHLAVERRDMNTELVAS